MTFTKYVMGAVLAALVALSTSQSNLMAQVYNDGYDQQQWWNPGDWFDDRPEYNLYSDSSDTYETSGYNNRNYGDWFDDENYWEDTWDYDEVADYDYYYDGYDFDYEYDE